MSKAPDGMVGERTLRSMIRSIATKLKKEKLTLTVPETLALLRQQDRLSKELRQCAAARLEGELAKK